MAKTAKKSPSGKKPSAGKKGGQPKPVPAPAQTSSTRADLMSGGEKVAWVCLHLAVFVVPIAMSNWTWLGFDLPLTYDQFDIIKVFFQRFFGLIAIGAWGWSALTRGGKLRRTKLDWFVLAFLAWVALTVVFSIHWPTAVFGKYRRFEGLVSFVNYAVFFFLTVQLVDRPARIRSLARTLFFASVFVAFYGILQYAGADPVRWGALPFEETRAFSTYGNPDLLGGFLMFPLPLALTLALSERNQVWRGVYWVGFLMTAVVWIISFVRGAWIGGAFALLLVAFAAWRSRTRFETVDWAFTGLSAVAGAAVVGRSLSNTGVLNFWDRIRSIFQFGSGSALTRFEIWDAAIRSIRDRPIFGFGADTFRLVFPRYKPYEYVADAGYLSVADNVHNYPLQLASGIGIPGFLLLYGIFGYTAWITAPIAFAKDRGGERLVLAGWWIAAAAYVVHLFFGLSVTGSSFLLWIALAVILTPLAKTIEFKAPSWGLVPATLLAAVVALALVGNFSYIIADSHYLRGRIPLPGTNAVSELVRAVNLNPYNDMYRGEIGLAYQDVFMDFATRAQNSQSSGQEAAEAFEQANTYFRAAESAMQEAIEFVPWEYDNYVFLANLYNAAGSLLGPSYFEDAVVIAKKGIEVEENGPAIRFQLARALLSQGKEDEAVEVLEYAARMDPRYSDPIVTLVDVYKQRGETEKARELLDWVLKEAPGNASAQAALDSLDVTATTVTP